MSHRLSCLSTQRTSQTRPSGRHTRCRVTAISDPRQPLLPRIIPSDVRRPRIRHPHGGAIRRCHEGWTGKPPSPLAAASALAWCLQRWASADRSRGPPSPSESQSYDLTRLPSADKCRAGARAASPQADAAPATRWLYTACDRPLISRVTDPGSSPRLEPRQPSCRARATRGARGETHRWR